MHEAQSEALLDSGAFSCFAHYRFVQEHGLQLRRLTRDVRVYNADATENKKGLISHYIRCQVQIGNHTSWQSFLVADIGRQDLIIGMSFLREHNPEIDWKNGQLEFSRCPTGCKPPTTPVHKEELEGILPHLEDVARDEFGDLEPGSWETQEQLLHWVSHSEDPSARILRAKTKDLHDTPGVKDKDYWSKHVPPEYHEFGDVFSKQASERMPVRKPYDHTIELTGPLPKPAKLYPLNLEERTSLDAWIDEQLAKGYIRTSKSPTAAPVFFVKKKDGSLRLVQDYRALNAVTKKDKFPIPRIPDLIDRLSQSSIFTSLDLRWGYNNVRIREGDEEKAAFMTHRGLFEPTVMTFGLCNAPSTYDE